jgi:hypothetical protein
MDPTANLNRQLELAEDLATSGSPAAAELAELVLALDLWLTRGGFRPEPWARQEAP